MYSCLSPLRYPGSKRKITTYLQKIIEVNHLSPNVLIEPFAGGASVSLFFLSNDLINEVVIADKDKLVASFWKTVFENTDEFISFIKKVKINVNTFYKYKDIARNVNKHDVMKSAEACLFLNRTSFSGILKNHTGPIGGKNQKSKYKIDCRFNKNKLVEKIKYLAKYRNRVKVLCDDWKNVFKYGTEITQGKSILFYLDPPFYQEGNKIYRHFFNYEEHTLLRNAIVNLREDWILSYDRTPEIENLYTKYNGTHIGVPYSINSHTNRIEKELIITPLKLPQF